MADDIQVVCHFFVYKMMLAKGVENGIFENRQNRISDLKSYRYEARY
ncbi:hypothetical protein SAMN05660909_04275 [Chitinophaga terrae (ex Kim and Jung 2007)]|uniref:Uncharacterized protein n=1 Tax=Chitinophaga terrae (ex Kim and Jung 2007) TaxID=408074 RepID=A0A1H4FAH3_9BACT|nr:hypothetical protein [Chitinophaga terrae (ex Kim and Jung 2007)]SEA94211.1 hypothetical protein SAMN05660909_04275 [Chitinophaga terrae (ex Kim and Jung 2007)]